MSNHRLSDAANRLIELPFYKVMARANELEKEGKKIIHLEIGEPDFATPDHITKAGVDSILRGETKYVASAGLRELRGAIAKKTKEMYGFLPSVDQILVTPGGMANIYLLIRAVVNPGDEIIVPSPGFSTYNSVAAFTGAKAVFVPLKEKNGFQPEPRDIEKLVTKKTKLIIIDSPSNPTGAMLNKDRAERLAKLVKKYNLYLLTDEVYNQLSYDRAPYSPAVFDKCKERTIILHGFSKTYAMTGWRVGYSVGPEPVIAKMITILQLMLGSMPPFVQMAALAALEGDQKLIKKRIATYKVRRKAIVEGLNSLPGVSCVMPDGAFYAFPNIKKTRMSSEEFALMALEEAGVALVPGSNFGEYGEGYVRICYSTSMGNIKTAIKNLKDALKKRNA